MNCVSSGFGLLSSKVRKTVDEHRDSDAGEQKSLDFDCSSFGAVPFRPRALDRLAIQTGLIAPNRWHALKYRDTVEASVFADAHP